VGEELFRAEALAYRARRLEGDVVLSRSLPQWYLTILLLTTTGALAVWVAFGQYNHTETVAGEITPQGALAKVYADRPGRLTWLGVSEGELVDKNRPLASIRMEQSLAGGASPGEEKLVSLSGQADIARHGLALESARATTERTRILALIGQYSQEGTVLRTQLNLEREVVDSAGRNYRSTDQLARQGLATKTDSEQRRQTWFASAAQMQNTIQQLSELAERESQANADLGKLPIDHAQKMAELQGTLYTLDQHRIDAEGAKGYTITAPITGRVTALQTAAGRNVDSRLPIFSIVPSNARMVATLFAPSRAIGLARLGQPVRLMYDAYPYQHFGSYGGRIVSIARTVLAPTEVDTSLKIEEPVYEVKVALDDQSIRGFGQQLALQPGMTLHADIVLDRRSFLSWLMEPLEAVRRRG
jgi:membrane fusion protein